MSDRPSQADWLAALPGMQQHGGEYHGPCPCCGGSDRFRVLPDGAVFCRQCDASIADFRHAAGLNGAKPRVSRLPFGTGEPSHVWKLLDPDGQHVATHKRFDQDDGSKVVAWYRPDGSKGLGGRTLKSLPLYGIHRAAESRGVPVLTEGEKAADALRGAVGSQYLVLGTVTGAASTPGSTVLEPVAAHATDHLVKSPVYLWPDNDDEGRRHMQRIAEALVTLGAQVRVIDWPDAPAKGDAADWIAAGQRPSMLELREAAQPVDETAAPASEAKPSTVEATGVLSEVDLAGAYVDRHGTDRRYRSDGRWLRWIDSTWQPDRGESLLEMTAMGRELFQRQDNRGNVRHDPTMGGRSSTGRGALSLAQPDCWSDVDEWDTDPWQVGIPGGLHADLRTGEIRQRTRNDLVTFEVSAHPADRWRGTRWGEFVAETFAADVCDWLRVLCGYALTALTGEHILLFIHGLDGTGKGTFMEALSKSFGSYARHIDPNDILEQQGRDHPAWLADLKGRRLVVADEIPRGKWNTPRLKSLVSADPVRARHMRQDFFEFKPVAQVLVSGNHAPMQTSADAGLARRLRVLRAENHPAPEKKDQHLQSKLLSADVLAWLFDGAAQYHDEGLPPLPESMVTATRTYAVQSDAIRQFLEGVPSWPVARSDLYRAYREATLDEGGKPLGKQRFNQTMREDYRMIEAKPAGGSWQWQLPDGQTEFGSFGTFGSSSVLTNSHARARNAHAHEGAQSTETAETAETAEPRLLFGGGNR